MSILKKLFSAGLIGSVLLIAAVFFLFGDDSSEDAAPAEGQQKAAAASSDKAKTGADAPKDVVKPADGKAKDGNLPANIKALKGNPQAKLTFVMKPPTQKVPDAMLQELKKLQTTVNKFNKNFMLKRPAKVIMRSQDTEYGIHCDLEEGNIYIPYDDLLINYQELLGTSSSRSAADKKEAAITVGRSAQVDLMHELGHLLINDFELPVPGNEEDACDNIAAFLLLSCYDDGKDNDYCSNLFMAWAETFLASAITEQGGTEVDLMDKDAFSSFISNQHSNSFKRAYNSYAAAIAMLLFNNIESADDVEAVAKAVCDENSFGSSDELYEGIISCIKSLSSWATLCEGFTREEE